MTDSVKCPTLSLRNCFPFAGVWTRETAGEAFLASLARSGDFGREEFVEACAGDFLDFLLLIELRFAIAGRLAAQQRKIQIAPASDSQSPRFLVAQRFQRAVSCRFLLGISVTLNL